MKNLLSLVLLFSTTFIFAQTGPGGVGNSSNNVIWLDGNIVTTATYPNISAWPDQSGNGNDFSQATDAKRPSVVTYSGFNGLRFDGADWLRRGATAALNSNNHTQFIVYNGYTANHVGILFESSFTESNQFIRTYRQNGNLRSWVLNSSLAAVSNTTTNSSAFQILSSVWDGTAQSFNSYKDGTSFGSQTGANGNPTGNNNNTIGAASNNAYRINGDMGEMIIFNTAINTAQRNIIENYLSSKFNVSTSNDMYAYDAASTHGNQVIGIGQEADGNNLTAQGKGIVELSVGSLNNGDYVFTGHNNTNLSTTTNDVPADIIGGSRLLRTWRVDVTGTPGNIDLVFDVSSLTLPAGAYYLLVESVNGIFNDGGVVEYGPFADVGGLVTFSGVAFADGDYFTIASGSNSEIASIATGNWNSISTWSCNCIPVANDDVTITVGHTVTATSSITVNDLTINGTLNTIQISDFNIKGDLTINNGGSFVNKTVKFNGTTAQTMTNNAATTINFSTLILNNSNGASILSGNFSCSGSLFVSNGVLSNVGGSFTMLSTATSTAVIINGAGGFSGNFTMQRYISQRNASWGDLSSPVTNNHLRDWDSNPAGDTRELYMCGVSGISGDCGGWQSVYYYDENIQDYVAVTDTSYILAPGKGLELWLADDETTLNNTTFDSRGVPNFGNIVVPVVNSWNLVGNPYQAWINWSSVTKPTISGAYYIWNADSGSYIASTTGSIPPGQGFWVESSGSGNLTFTESAKTGSGSSLFYKIFDEESLFTEVSISVRNISSNYSSRLKLRLNEKASLSYDEFDAGFLPSRLKESPSIYTFSLNSSKQLAISSFDNAQDIKLPITIKSGKDGKHLINISDFVLLNEQYKFITLTDTKTNHIYDLKQTHEFEIDLTSEEQDARFELRLSNNYSVLSSNSLAVNIYKSNTNTIVEFSNPNVTYDISIVNVLGQKVIDDFVNVTGNNLIIPNAKIPAGLNIISVKSNNNQTFIQKLNY